MIGRIYLLEEDSELFRGMDGGIELRQYEDGVLTSELTSPDVLSKAGQKFVQGRRGSWLPEIPGKRLGPYPCVRINNNSAYANLGLILVDCDRSIIHYHETLHHSRNSPVIVKINRTDFSFERRALIEYNSDSVSKPAEKDHHLLVYAPIK